MNMAKEQVLVISPPSEISFKGPYNRVVTEQLTLTNPTDSHIAFKVKTTAPRRYCVRPNNGFIAPKKNVVVSVMLQPQNKEEILSEKHKHKFMIQSVVSPVDNGTVEDIFKQSGPGEVMDSKFRCVFEDISVDERPRTPDYNMAASRMDNASDVKHSAPADSDSVQNNPAEDKQPTEKSSGGGGGSPIAGSPADDPRLRDLVEENRRLNSEIASLKLKGSPSSSQRITGAIPVNAQAQPAGLSWILILIVAIISLILGLFIGYSR